MLCNIYDIGQSIIYPSILKWKKLFYCIVGLAMQVVIGIIPKLNKQNICD